MLRGAVRRGRHARRVWCCCYCFCVSVRAPPRVCTKYMLLLLFASRTSPCAVRSP